MVRLVSNCLWIWHFRPFFFVEEHFRPLRACNRALQSTNYNFLVTSREICRFWSSYLDLKAKINAFFFGWMNQNQQCSSNWEGYPTSERPRMLFKDLTWLWKHFCNNLSDQAGFFFLFSSWHFLSIYFLNAAYWNCLRSDRREHARFVDHARPVNDGHVLIQKSRTAGRDWVKQASHIYELCGDRQGDRINSSEPPLSQRV